MKRSCENVCVNILYSYGNLWTFLQSTYIDRFSPLFSLSVTWFLGGFKNILFIIDHSLMCGEIVVKTIGWVCDSNEYGDQCKVME